MQHDQSYVARRVKRGCCIIVCFLGMGDYQRVLDILTRHTSESIQALFIVFNTAICRLNRGHVIMPRRVVTNFYVLIIAGLAAFSGGVQLDIPATHVPVSA